MRRRGDSRRERETETAGEGVFKVVLWRDEAVRKI